MATTSMTGTKPAPISSTGRCCSCGCPPVSCTCCELVCFERPDYHCGHLLTDADLSLQVRYVVEKNKLRNRTLHGHGVVCGLKLTCDPLCDDHILVHEGYAIDDCGNDIVVCETMRFDLIAALKAKHLIVKARERESCDPAPTERECHVPQCFYVSICYEEEDAAFQTPFQSGCAGGPQDCVPTRVKERFRLEVSDTRPKAYSYLDRLEEKMRHCFRLFLDSPVGRLIAQNLALLNTVAGGNAAPAAAGAVDKNCETFCLLKAQFQQYLKTNPDELSCRLAKQVAALKCPEQASNSYVADMSAAFGKLFELMHRYQYDCVLADLVFSCEAPDEACCVLLGAVLMEDGCITRVNNTPRDYVWSFANLAQVLTSEILTAATMGKGDERRPGGCCESVMNFEMDRFLREFEIDGAARFLAASAPIRAMRAVQSSFATNFAFTDSAAIAPALFAHADAKNIARMAEALGIGISSPDGALELAKLNPMQALLSESLMRSGDSLRTYPGTESTIRQVLPDYEAEVSPERVAVYDRASTDAALAQRDATIATLSGRLDAMQQRLDAMAAAPAPAPGKPGKSSGPA
jgi:hypothetical protein